MLLKRLSAGKTKTQALLSMHINLSATLEQALSQELVKREVQKWKDDHKAAIKAYNEFVEEHG